MFCFASVQYSEGQGPVNRVCQKSLGYLHDYFHKVAWIFLELSEWFKGVAACFAFDGQGSGMIVLVDWEALPPMGLQLSYWRGRRWRFPVALA